MDPQQWLLQYDEKLKAVAARAERADKALREVGGSATSPDGDITVRVSASGATTGLVLRPGVRDVEPEQLARMILETTRQAQRDAGAQVVEAMRELVGESEALEVVKSHLPEGYAGDGEDLAVGGPDLVPDTRPDDEYFENPPEVIK
ncbi:MAG TPA: YbaB/EbfC family nucleoid-associated protein [Actinophytocola sp.]|uniref:YbaB/EbfC family nucleoid-associated protein n=1 Tax=Actinophytocola sp. TaxID=1872138 RepID=UPI002DDD7073|nr:YbaB/EbfC family nucleoid-associated protein [Actinophytocola sp.]HEV2781702.1 YbaB/EbfC family nucleoid-associated protein [Actinophytocola sp.]